MLFAFVVTLFTTVHANSSPSIAMRDLSLTYGQCIQESWSGEGERHLKRVFTLMTKEVQRLPHRDLVFEAFLLWVESSNVCSDQANVFADVATKYYFNQINKAELSYDEKALRQEILYNFRLKIGHELLAATRNRFGF